jgi:hypothetical protein
MRRWLAFIPMMVLLLSSCGPGDGEKSESLALQVRARAMEASACRMTADVTADYGDRVYGYTLSYQWNREGDSRITVEAPETIQGITAVIHEGEVRLTYEEAGLETGALDQNGLAPLDALPALLRMCREGYISQADLEPWGEIPAARITYGEADTSAVDAVQYRIWFSLETEQPVYGEILSGGRVVLQCTFHSVEWT